MHAPFKDIVEAIGLPAALKFVERFAGLRLYFPQPRHLTQDHAIVQTIGMEAASKLVKLWPQEYVCAPTARAHLLAERNRALRLDYETLSASACARKYRISERMVYRIVSSPAADAVTRQP